MPHSRYSKRINVTIPPNLLGQVDTAVAHYGASRSVVIRMALRDWLEGHVPIKRQPEAADDKPKLPEINPEVPFHKLINPNMSEEELLDLLQAYEAAKNIRYN